MWQLMQSAEEIENKRHKLKTLCHESCPERTSSGGEATQPERGAFTDLPCRPVRESRAT